MDPKRPHELPNDDLTDAFANFQGWWEKNGMVLLICVLVVAAVVFGKRYYEAHAKALHEEEWSELATATNPESYENVAKEYSDPAVSALANLRGADLLVKDFATPQSADPTRSATSQPSPEARKQNLEIAARMYQKVADQSGAAPLYRLNAMLGLATVAEDRGEWKDAEKWYGKVVDQAGDYTAIKAQAGARLAVLPHLSDRVVFAPEVTPAPLPPLIMPMPTKAPVTQPAAKP